MFVRLNAYNPKRGNVLQRFNFKGVRFDAGKWYGDVPKDMAEYLREVRQEDGVETSPLAFTVVETGKDAQDVEDRERNARALELQRAAARETGTGAIRVHQVSRGTDGKNVIETVSSDETKGKDEGGAESTASDKTSKRSKR